MKLVSLKTDNTGKHECDSLPATNAKFQQIVPTNSVTKQHSLNETLSLINCQPQCNT